MLRLSRGWFRALIGITPIEIDAKPQKPEIVHQATGFAARFGLLDRSVSLLFIKLLLLCLRLARRLKRLEKAFKQRSEVLFHAVERLAQFSRQTEFGKFNSCPGILL